MSQPALAETRLASSPSFSSDKITNISTFILKLRARPKQQQASMSSKQLLITSGAGIGVLSALYIYGRTVGFKSTHEIVSETPLPASTTREAAIALLHDHTTFQNLQPLVIDNKIIPPPPSTSYLVTESTSLSSSSNGTPVEYRQVTISVPMGPFSSTVISRSATIDTEDGVIVFFQAPMGMYGKNQFRVVKDGQGKGLVLREEAKLTGYSVLMPFVLGTEEKNHGEQRRKVGRELKRRAEAAGGK
ncbi:uncharacterized protein PAC_07970 [Phialocephala subalpina]|uniref:DUF7053 domain-containing protein n=1 Tax=Phialocephala subalpina TaxID=576137 RepID=A0A1L7WZ89_9HELO|nr:uncharacterized protein PAC_07970 [Phialocephala subalpina]